MSANGGFSMRTQRLLVRVLLALRCEACRSADPALDERRAEELADRIMFVLPRRVLPVGLCALVLVAMLCAVPLARDFMPASGDIRPASQRLEDSIREQGAAVNAGLGTLRAVVAPFASDDAGSQEPAATALPDGTVALAPFKRS
ncbi:MAG: hypothetical protein ACKOYN_12030 [Planctomycetota bacterium]